MAIETLLETNAQLRIDGSFTPTGTINAAVAGANALVGTGTNFNGLTVGDVLEIIDATTGRPIYVTLQTITDALNVVIVGTLVRDIAVGSTWHKLSISSPYFVVDDPATAAAFPTKFRIYNGGVSIPLKNQASTTNVFINQHEGVLVKSIYVRMPYQFTLADTYLAVRFRYSDQSLPLVFVNMVDLGISGVVAVPLENVEVPVNKYVRPYQVVSAGTTNWNFNIQIFNASADQRSAILNEEDVPYVSEINTPASLDREFLPIVVGIRIVHGNVLV